MNDTYDRVREIVSTLFNIDVSTITRDSSTKTVPEWDSMGQLMLVIELEQLFNIEISPESAEKLTSVSAIIDIVDGGE